MAIDGGGLSFCLRVCFGGAWLTIDSSLVFYYSWRGSLRRCLITSEWNVEGGRHCVVAAGFLVFFGHFDEMLG